MDTPNTLTQGIEYLRAEAIESHLAGDGIRVAHLATLALRGAAKHATPSLSVSDIRWAIFLSLYWMIDDDLTLYSIENGVAGTREGILAEFDGALCDFLHNAIDRPPPFQDLEQVPPIPKEWVYGRANCTEDVAAICLAFELAWANSPNDTSWREQLQTLCDSSPAESLLHRSATSLQARLHIQADLCFGKAELPQGDLGGTTASAIQSTIAKGWYLFLQDNIADLELLLETLAITVSTTRSEYPSLFHLAHFSRLSRSSNEDQFIALARYADASRSQRTNEVAQLRSKRFSQTYRYLAERGFAKNEASKRLTCLRMAVIGQLSALREWDIAEWIMAKSEEASILLELGASGDIESARRGLIATVRSLGPIKDDKYPNLSASINITDALSVESRADLIDQLLSTPKRAAGSTNQLLEFLSDSIPESQLLDVARWSAKLEKEKLSYAYSISFLDWWYEVIYFAPNASDIVDALVAPMLHTIATPAAWDVLSETICWSIVRARQETAEKLLDTLLKKEIVEEDAHFNECRFSIAIRVANERDSLRPKCLAWLNAFSTATAARPRTGLHAHLVRQIGLSKNTPTDDAQLREWIRERLHIACRLRLEEKGPSFSIFSESFHGAIRRTTWPDIDVSLIDALVQVVDDAGVPFTNKWDTIACLGAFVEVADDGLVERISLEFERWIRDGVKGRDLGFKSTPLSTGHVSGMDDSAIASSLWFLAGALTKRASLTYLDRFLHKWVIVEAPRVNPDQLSDAVQVAIILARRLQSVDAGMATGLVAISEAAVVRSDPAQLPKVIDGFRVTAFGSGKLSPESEEEIWLRTDSGRFCLTLWSRRLHETGKSARPEIRRATAAAVATWGRSVVDLPPQLTSLKATLAADCRMRVRHQIH